MKTIAGTLTVLGLTMIAAGCQTASCYSMMACIDPVCCVPACTESFCREPPTCCEPLCCEPSYCESGCNDGVCADPYCGAIVPVEPLCKGPVCRVYDAAPMCSPEPIFSSPFEYGDIGSSRFCTKCDSLWHKLRLPSF